MDGGILKWYSANDSGSTVADNILVLDHGTGKVGVGTATPLAPLHVHESSDSAGSLYITTDSAPAGTAYAGLWLGTDLNGSDDWAGLIFDRANDNILRLVNSGSSGATTGILIDASGNVGIGVDDPDAKLEVAGQVKITGGTPGADKVLTSDADGLASWEDAGGGGVDIATVRRWSLL